jgi:hypothetical protein
LTVLFVPVAAAAERKKFGKKVFLRGQKGWEGFKQAVLLPPLVQFAARLCRNRACLRLPHLLTLNLTSDPSSQLWRM